LQIFRQQKHQEQFDRDGVISFPALNTSQIAEVITMYSDVKPLKMPDGGIYSNITEHESALNWQISERMIEIFRPFLEKHFINYKVSGGMYLVKNNGPESGCPLHQDYNLVDEALHSAVNIWCPLTDVNEKNGCLQAVLGSHRMFDTIRSLNIPSIRIDFEERLEKHLTAFPVEAGTAIVYSLNLFHGSKPNNSDKVRVATVMTLSHESACRMHFLKNEENIQVVSAEKNFVFETVRSFHLEGKLTGLEQLRILPVDTKTSITVEEFYNRIDSKQGEC